MSRFFNCESIVNPRIVKVLSHSMPSSGQSMSFLSVLLPMGITTVFATLQASPDILWKALMYFVAYSKLCAVLCRNIVVSSAKVSLLASYFAKIIPVRFFVWLIFKSSISTRNIPHCLSLIINDYQDNQDYRPIINKRSTDDHQIHISMIHKQIGWFFKLGPCVNGSDQKNGGSEAWITLVG